MNKKILMILTLTCIISLSYITPISAMQENTKNSCSVKIVTGVEIPSMGYKSLRFVRVRLYKGSYPNGEFVMTKNTLFLDNCIFKNLEMGENYYCVGYRFFYGQTYKNFKPNNDNYEVKLLFDY